MARLGREHLGGMSQEGDSVKRRREALGWDITSSSPDTPGLDKRSGVHRNTITSIEAGNSFNRTTLKKIEDALAAGEKEAGIGAPPPNRNDDDLVEFEIFTGDRDSGLRVVVKGPIRDMAELEASAQRLIAQMREKKSDS